MKIVVTGGHIAPALAVIEALPKNVEVVFVGRKFTFEGDSTASFEYREITKRGIPFFHLQSGRLQRSITRHTIPSLFRLPNGVRQARTLLKEISPDVVLSFGGYVGLPMVTAAATLRIPSVIHEQTTRAGFANRFTARFAAKVCISFETSRTFFPEKKTVLTGNPLRKDILENKKSNTKSVLPLIYITGGSGGSHAINLLVRAHLQELLAISSVIHQTGDAGDFKDYEQLVALRSTLPKILQDRYIVKKFLFSGEAASAMSSSDLVVGRSGINTVSELIYFEKPALCIPLPTGQRGEQEQNALLLTALGLGRMLRQETADALFVAQIKEMLNDLSGFRLNDPSMKERFSSAAGTIVSILSDVAHAPSNKKT